MREKMVRGNFTPARAERGDPEGALGRYLRCSSPNALDSSLICVTSDSCTFCSSFCSSADFCVRSPSCCTIDGTAGLGTPPLFLRLGVKGVSSHIQREGGPPNVPRTSWGDRRFDGEFWDQKSSGGQKKRPKLAKTPPLEGCPQGHWGLLAFPPHPPHDIKVLCEDTSERLRIFSSFEFEKN